MNCPTGNPVIDLIKGFFDFLGNPIGTVIELIANTILAGAVAVFGALITGVPTLTGTATAKNVGSQTQWLVVYLAVGSLIFASVRMALERRGTAGVTALKGILRVILVSGAATTVVTAAAAVADDYATYLFNAGAQAQLSNVGACKSGDNVQSFLLLVLAFLLLISGIIHTILMYIRLGVMILLLGTLPLAAAASMTDWGSGWWRKHIGWMIAWLLYKPAAGLVLYSGSAMISQGGQGGDINERIAGIGLMLLSAVSLPALLKLVVPATAALGGGNPVSGALASAGALATGARPIGGSGGSGGQAGATGAKGPSGAGSSGGSPGGAAGPGGPAGLNGANGGGPGGGSMGAGAGGGGSGAAAGAGRAAAAAGGPAGAAVAAAVTAAKIVGSTASGALDGADGDLGHNK
ncbi:hypothetical protein [Streptomyces sp. NPDC003635]